LKKLADAAETNKRYQRLRADRIKKQAGYDDVNSWDLTFVPEGFQRPRFTIDEATRTIKEALAPFGPEYAGEVEKLLDPGHGRLDIAGGTNRVPGAFAWGFPGSQVSIFYSMNYEGYYDDVETLIHESGHAVHYELMARNKVLPDYSSGPTYFTESFSMFNELLLSDYLYRKETDPAKKTWYLERLMDSATAVYPVARQAAIEQGMYDGVAAGKLKTADDFDNMTQAIGEKYSIWYSKHPQARKEWSMVHHFFTQPMYYVIYVFAQMLALKYYEMYQRDPKGFVPKYLALVKNGFDAPPTTLLKKFLNIDFKDPKLVTQALSVVEGKLGELERLYIGARP
jgi:oligoendopeptidase F